MEELRSVRALEGVVFRLAGVDHVDRGYYAAAFELAYRYATRAAWPSVRQVLDQVGEHPCSQFAGWTMDLIRLFRARIRGEEVPVGFLEDLYEHRGCLENSGEPITRALGRLIIWRSFTASGHAEAVEDWIRSDNDDPTVLEQGCRLAGQGMLLYDTWDRDMERLRLAAHRFGRAVTLLSDSPQGELALPPVWHLQAANWIRAACASEESGSPDLEVIRSCVDSADMTASRLLRHAEASEEHYTEVTARFVLAHLQRARHALDGPPALDEAESFLDGAWRKAQSFEVHGLRGAVDELRRRIGELRG